MGRRYRDDDDDYDDEDRPRRRRNSGAGGMEYVVPYRNGMALAAYYTGIFGLIPCFLGCGALGVIPLLLGIFGLVKAHKDRNAHGSAHAWVGILLGAVELLLGLATIGFVIVMIWNAPGPGGRR